MEKWDESGSVPGATMKACLDCGAELVATWTETHGGKPTAKSRLVTLVYIPPCSGK